MALRPFTLGIWIRPKTHKLFRQFVVGWRFSSTTHYPNYNTNSCLGLGVATSVSQRRGCLLFRKVSQRRGCLEADGAGLGRAAPAGPSRVRKGRAEPGLTGSSRAGPTRPRRDNPGLTRAWMGWAIICLSAEKDPSEIGCFTQPPRPDLGRP